MEAGALEELCRVAEGDLRRSITLLQSTSLLHAGSVSQSSIREVRPPCTQPDSVRLTRVQLWTFTTSLRTSRVAVKKTFKEHENLGLLDFWVLEWCLGSFEWCSQCPSAHGDWAMTSAACRWPARCRRSW